MFAVSGAAALEIFAKASCSLENGSETGQQVGSNPSTARVIPRAWAGSAQDLGINAWRLCCRELGLEGRDHFLQNPGGLVFFKIFFLGVTSAPGENLKPVHEQC